MSRVLVVGSRSPLGRVVGGALASAGHAVVGTSRTGIDATQLDISDPETSRDVLDQVRPHAVVMLARPELPDDDADAAVESAIHDVARFATDCGDAGVERVIFASSAAVYGTGPGSPWREDGPTAGRGPYATLKLHSEKSLAASGITAISLRIFNVYGPRFTGSLVNRLLNAASGGEPPEVFASDDFIRDYVHADDVAAVFAAAADNAVPAGVYNVGTGIGTSNLELLQMIPEARWRPAGELTSPSISIADVARIQAALGVRTQLRLAEVIRHSLRQARPPTS